MFRGFFNGFDQMMFAVVPVIIFVGFICVFVMVVRTFAASARQNRRDSASPVLTVPAAVVTKRTDVHHSHMHTGNHIHTYSRYYATFQVESGDRMELMVPDTVYGLLAEGDWGRLTFQGSRFLDFNREGL